MQISVISGGTATNAIVGSFGTKVAYIMPISDNGGSSWEIQRVFGGVAIGDLRSRIVRLVQREDLRVFWAHRLKDGEEWEQLLNGESPLWFGIDSTTTMLLKTYLEEVSLQIQNRKAQFNFGNASVGNLILTGLSFKLGDLQHCIEIMGGMGDMPKTQKVIPCINTNVSMTIAVELVNGDIISGQNEISHPSDSPLVFDKDHVPNLVSPIGSLFYVHPNGEEYHPRASQDMLNELESSGTIVYSIGSLWTSLVPVLVLHGVGQKIAKCKRRVLLVNGTLDRETYGMNVVDILKVIVSSLQYSITGVRRNALEMDLEQLEIGLEDTVDEVVVLEDGEIPLSKSLAVLPVKLRKLKGKTFEVDNLKTLFS